MRIVFLGTSSFAAKTLTFLKVCGAEVVAVITRPDRPRGRSPQPLPPPVKVEALKAFPDVPIFQPEKASTSEFAEELKSLHPDLFVVVAYGEIIKKNLLEIPPKGSVNIHASLLPKYRGAAPMQRALMDGVNETGVTIIEMTPQMDAGDVLASASLSVPLEMCLGDLEPKLCELGCQTLLHVLEQIESGTVKKVPQEHAQATLAPKIKPEEEQIFWDKPAISIHNLIRALSPRPGAWATILINGEVKRLKIIRSAVVLNMSGMPGENLKFNKEGWIVACSFGALRLLEVQLEGKKALSTEEFIRGQHYHPSFNQK